MRALAIGNGNDFDVGFVGHRFREHGYAFTECHREHPDRWPALDSVELVLTLGSEWNVYRPETTERVEAEAALLRETFERDVPIFAICFGAQVLAHALGGTVSRMPAPEIGWLEVPLEVGRAAKRSGAGELGRRAQAACTPSEPEYLAGPWLEWHYDTFTVPDGFDVMARNDVGPQLIRGGRSLATQFHPEVTETMVVRWLGMGGAEQLRQHGLEPVEVLAQTRTNVEQSGPNAAALVDWFLATIAQPSE